MRLNEIFLFHKKIPLSLRYVLFPKLNGVFCPSFSVRAGAESKTMTYIPILAILDFIISCSCLGPTRNPNPNPLRN